MLMIPKQITLSDRIKANIQPNVTSNLINVIIKIICGHTGILSIKVLNISKVSVNKSLIETRVA